METNFRSAMLRFAGGLALAAIGAQAGAQATPHDHSAPSAHKPTAAMKGTEATKGMHAMMADPAMREKMMANMAQCRDMMTMMMEHMRHDAEMAKRPSQPKQ